MDHRKKITLAFQYEENWIGGTYYILNIIKSLHTIKDEDKPHITILYNPQSSVKEIGQINYPYIDFQPFDPTLPFLMRKVNRLFSLVDADPFFRKKIPAVSIDNFYPAPCDLDKSNIKKYYAWIPDFQEHYLPEYFVPREIADRKLSQRKIVRSQMPVVFSSHSALSDFNKLYPGNKNQKAVLPFVSVLDTRFNELSTQALFEKFGIRKPYFIVTNQFWKHKNHLTVIKAFKELYRSNPGIQLVLTGKEHDYRNPDYPGMLRKFVSDNGLEKAILFLGFIDRAEQLKLMKESLAIVQPSLFEGWSTVVEDAKALGKFIILSNIPVHREQIDKNCLFFEPLDTADLVEKLSVLVKQEPAAEVYNYEESIRSFAYRFLSLF